MGVHNDLRTFDEKFDDYIADDMEWAEIAARLSITELQARAHFEKIKKEMGWQAR